MNAVKRTLIWILLAATVFWYIKTIGPLGREYLKWLGLALIILGGVGALSGFFERDR